MCALLMLGISGCAIPLPFNQQKQARSTAERIISAIADKDIDELRSLFSIKAIEDSDSFDEGIQHILYVIEGDVQSIDFGASDNEILRGDPGDRTSILKNQYIVTTTSDKYLLFTTEYVESTVEPELLGLYQLQIIKEDDKELEFFWGSNFGSGIYQPTCG